MNKSELAGKKCKVYQGDRLEGIATIKAVEAIYDTREANCEVEFKDEPGRTYRRWVKVGDLL